MANFLTIDELKTHLYEETVNEITRNDDTVVETAIETAIDECKGYLSKYDTVSCMDNVAPIDRNRKLLSVCKEIASWHLINLCNVNIQYDTRRAMYEDAISWLESVQKGLVVPVNMPVANIPNTTTPITGISWKSNHKRGNHF